MPIDGGVLPPSPQPFNGVIEFNASQSKPCWPMRVAPFDDGGLLVTRRLAV
jgi:hypothetical protein